MKPNHAGPKNGGGHWGTRSEAKRLSNHQRRQDDRVESGMPDHRARRGPSLPNGHFTLEAPSPDYVPSQDSAPCLPAHTLHYIDVICDAAEAHMRWAQDCPMTLPYRFGAR